MSILRVFCLVLLTAFAGAATSHSWSKGGMIDQLWANKTVVTGELRKPQARTDITVIGTYDLTLVETTPIVLNKELFLLRSVRWNYWNNTQGDLAYLQFENVKRYPTPCPQPVSHPGLRSQPR
jgi:hypothetical protein